MRRKITAAVITTAALLGFAGVTAGTASAATAAATQPATHFYV